MIVSGVLGIAAKRKFYAWIHITGKPWSDSLRLAGVLPRKGLVAKLR
jgi:hypothetical protein